MSEDSPTAKRLYLQPWTPTLILAVLLVYGQAAAYPYTNWDDNKYILENTLLNSVSVPHFFELFRPGSIPGEALYIPLTYLTFFAEAVLFGLNSTVTHCLNIILHLVNTVLVFKLAARWASGAGAARENPRRAAAASSKTNVFAFIAALIFALHPLQVETVAWAMGRKDLLAACFTLLCLLAYHRFLDNARRRDYVWALVLFAAAALSKPVVILLPVFLFALDIFRHGHVRRRDVVHKLPFAALSVLVWLLNLITTAAAGGSGSTDLSRLAMLPTVVTGWFLRLLLLAPSRVMYLVPDAAAVERTLLPCVVLLLFVIGPVILAWRRYGQAARCGLVFAVVMCVPALSLVLSADREFITADRYGYLAVFGVAVLVCATAPELKQRWRAPLAIAASVWLAMAAVASFRQVQVWQSSTVIWESVLEQEPGYLVALNGLGMAYAEDGKLRPAAETLAEAIRRDPEYREAYANLGNVLYTLEEWTAAERCFKAALDLDAALPESHYNLGLVHLRMGKIEDALKEVGAAVTMQPDYAAAHYTLGQIYEELARPDAAVGEYAKTVELAPGFTAAHFRLGALYFRLRFFNDALKQFREVTRQQPRDYRAYLFMAQIKWNRNKTEEAMAIYGQALANDGDTVGLVHYELARKRRELGQIKEAAEHILKATALEPRNGSFHHEAAQIFKEMNNMPKAKQHAELAKKYGVGEGA